METMENSKKRMWGLKKFGAPEWMARQSVGFANHYQAVAKTTGLRKISKEGGCCKLNN